MLKPKAPAIAIATPPHIPVLKSPVVTPIIKPKTTPNITPKIVPPRINGQIGLSESIANGVLSSIYNLHIQAREH